MPAEVGDLWRRVPPELPSIENHLAPVKDWLAARAGPGDYALIQGDFGACFILVRFAFEQGLIPVYSTTEREAEEIHLGGGGVQLSHRFRHVIFRRYEMTRPAFQKKEAP